ncbi:MAG: thiosulfate dehydrogenase (quinone) large subunit [Thermoplasmata archaeon]|nr:thiosulfate dehydrogenase (quinone) large subunit [Thermoplasmata archaeon]
MDAVLGVARLALGAIFLWAFLDKLFGLGFSTPAERAWLAGGSPTKGYLSSAVGPMAGFFHGIAGNPVADVLFMAGLAGVGLALLLGVGVRVAGFAGAAMMFLMYAAHPIWAASPATHPFLDDHLVYALMLVAFAVGGTGRHVGLGAWWAQQPLVQRHPWLE